MDDIWIRLETWLGTNVPAIAMGLAAGASEDDIEEAEADLEHALPADVRASLLRHNGQLIRDDGEPIGGGLLDGWALRGIADIVPEWRMLNGSLEGGDIPKSIEADPEVRPVWWNPAWIPITADGAGNAHCIDLDPAPGGTAGQIIYFFYDAPERALVAASFREWLTDLADDLENGRQVYSKALAGIVAKELADEFDGSQ